MAQRISTPNINVIEVNIKERSFEIFIDKFLNIPAYSIKQNYFYAVLYEKSNGLPY